MNPSTHKEASPDQIVSYYDSFSERLLRDYIEGNRRVDAAIETASSCISPATRRVLDVGCGIGTSSFRFRENCDWLTVHGVDISSRNVETAEKLFGGEGLVFQQSDMESVPGLAPYDLITLLDVYEHVPNSKWARFNQVLADCLAPQGVVVLTAPTPLHQRYLAEYKPEGLQVVDEIIEPVHVLALADALDATITSYRFVSVWRTNDYLHVVLERCPAYQHLPQAPLRRRSLIGRIMRRLGRLTDVDERRLRVRQRLQLTL